MWGATLDRFNNAKRAEISIHAPRVGSDLFFPKGWPLFVHFNPRSPCGERQNSNARAILDAIFQSTLPVWGATHLISSLHIVGLISIQAPRVGSDSPITSRSTSAKANFNPRSPCGERLLSTGFYSRRRRFQSTLPVWGATLSSCGRGGVMWISIHAPRVGSDLPHSNESAIFWHFNPRSPCGERRRRET